MNLNLKGKRALVFGASAGIGKAIAESLSEEGAIVTIASRTKEKLEAVSKELSCDYFVCDLSLEGEATRAVQYVMKTHGGIDILILNTGGPNKGNFSDIPMSQWKLDYQSLYLSSIEAINSALPSMKSSSFGRVIFVTSIAAKEPVAGLTTSNSLRAGIPGMCRSLAGEYSGDGITFNTLLPGYTNTERLQQLNLSEEKINEMVPAGRLGHPRELADLACFLSSEKGAYITAQSIAIDGGATKSI